MNLQLSLKKQWFLLTESGIKKEDYREVTPYWYARLVRRSRLASIKKAQLSFWISQLNNQEGLAIRNLPNLNEIFSGCFNEFTTNIMTLGYPSKTDESRILRYEHAGIEIRTGVELWGAEPNKLYFVIKHGKRIN